MPGSYCEQVTLLACETTEHGYEELRSRHPISGIRLQLCDNSFQGVSAAHHRRDDIKGKNIAEPGRSVGASDLPLDSTDDVSFDNDAIAWIGECGDTNSNHDTVHIGFEEDLRYDLDGRAKGKKKHKKRKRGLKKKKAPAFPTFSEHRNSRHQLSNIGMDLMRSQAQWDAPSEVKDLMYKGRMLMETVKVNQRQYEELVTLAFQGRQYLAKWFRLRSDLIEGFRIWDVLRDEQAQDMEDVSWNLRKNPPVASRQDWGFSAAVPEVLDIHGISSDQDFTRWNQVKIEGIIQICKEYNKVLIHSWVKQQQSERF